MTRPLEGVKVVEVAMWAFVPSAGAILADMGADVVKVEPPDGDPMRGLTTGGIPPGTGGFTYMWEIFNRGKRSVTLDLNLEGAKEVLHKMLEQADVFLTSLLPAARRKLGIDASDLRQRYPNLIYAAGSGQGVTGPDAEKGGYDSISFWARSGIASALTPEGHPYPTGMPSGAFGDALSGAIFAGGIAAAIAQRYRTGVAPVVDSSLLATGMWAMQPAIVGTSLAGREELPKVIRTSVANPLVNSYRTSDGRYVALSMLQQQRYWPDFCRAVGRQDLIDDERFSTVEGRSANIAECIALLDGIFSTDTLANWKVRLAKQRGQWDVVQKAGELSKDVQAISNGFIQDVDYGDGRSIKMVSTPVQFDGKPFSAGPAPELGAHSDQILSELGYSEEAILDLKIEGAVP